MSDCGILVGYDGSAASEDALAWAAREALARGAALTVCLAQVPRFPPPSAEHDSGDDPEGGARHLLERAVRRARDLMPAGDVRPLLANGPATAVLCKHCATADMVVVGSRGGGGLPELPIGSVGLQVAAHAPGRVVVIRGHWRNLPGQPGPVVVGTEGSAASKAAVTFALEEASLIKLTCWQVCALADAPGALGGPRRHQGRIRSADVEHAAEAGSDGATAYLRRLGPARAAGGGRRGPAARCRRPRARWPARYAAGLGRPGDGLLCALPGRSGARRVDAAGLRPGNEMPAAARAE